MIKTKLLSMKKDSNIIIYSISFDEEKLTKFLDRLDERYRHTITETVDALFSGLTPISYGKYDSLRGECKITELGILDTKKERLSEDYYKTIGGSSREWDFLTEEEKKLFNPVTGTKKGKLKLQVEFPSVTVKLLKEAFLGDEKKCIIDGTNLIKLSNHIFQFNNNFEFDKTIELDKKRKAWNDPSIAFFSRQDFDRYLSSLESNLNRDNIKMTAKEKNLLRGEFYELLMELSKQFYIEQVGMFPMNLTLSTELEILKRYGIRNESFDWFPRSLEYSPVNYDGGQIISSLRNTICNNYDLDGKENEKKILEDIYKKHDVVEYLTGMKIDEPASETKTKDVLTKVIKAA